MNMQERPISAVSTGVNNNNRRLILVILTDRKILETKMKTLEVKERLEKDKQVLLEKQFSLDKMKTDFMYKKKLVSEGQLQHLRTKSVIVNNNPYAATITADVQNQSKLFVKSQSR